MKTLLIVSLALLAACSGRDHNTPPSRIQAQQVHEGPGYVPDVLARYGIKPTEITVQSIVPNPGTTREVYLFERDPSYVSGDYTPFLTVERRGTVITTVVFVTPKTKYVLMPGPGGNLQTTYAQSAEGVNTTQDYFYIPFPRNDPAVAEMLSTPLLQDAEALANSFRAMAGH